MLNVTERLTNQGCEAPEIVPSQAEPDPDFPTVAFPNPEEPGAANIAESTGSRLTVVMPGVVRHRTPNA
jgi:phosphomannomutase